jgi:hypothetical protein
VQGVAPYFGGQVLTGYANEKQQPGLVTKLLLLVRITGLEHVFSNFA